MGETTQAVIWEGGEKDEGKSPKICSERERGKSNFEGKKIVESEKHTSWIGEGGKGIS